MKRFWNKVHKTNNCWLWVGAINGHGYGNFWFQRRYETSHRVMWKLTIGTIPEGLCVLHRCDVRHCVNPGHLWLGTQRDNIIDMVKKGRMTKHRANGENHHTTRLTMSQVVTIRCSSLRRSALAHKYKVTWNTIDNIQKGKTWKHVE